MSEYGHPLTVNSTGMMNAKVRVFEERYSGGVLDMNIFCFAFIYDNEYITNTSYIGGSTQSKKTKAATSISVNPSKKQNKDSMALEEGLEQI